MRHSRVHVGRRAVRLLGNPLVLLLVPYLDGAKKLSVDALVRVAPTRHAESLVKNAHIATGIFEEKQFDSRIGHASDAHLDFVCPQLSHATSPEGFRW
jgi:hypothetical protein